MERKKTGRPSKGDRRRTTVLLPVELLEEVKRYAAAHGMTVTDLVGESLADRIGATYQLQEGLPLDKAS